MVIKSKNFCIVLSSPSGAGKTSISKLLLSRDRSLSLSISCTTRPRRKGESDKKDYIFLSEEKFNQFHKKKSFLESANVFGYKYGTLKQTVNNFFLKRKDVIFDIDWKGYQQLKQSNMDVVGIFILPPSKAELIKRLRTRGRDTKYDYVVVNKDLQRCANSIKNIINSERLRRSRLTNLTNFVNKFRN